jgi:hypothetical protein
VYTARDNNFIVLKVTGIPLTTNAEAFVGYYFLGLLLEQFAVLCVMVTCKQQQTGRLEVCHSSNIKGREQQIKI